MESIKNYVEFTCKGALNKLKQSEPYAWDLNIYRGCGHHCRYCFALYSHDYMASSGISSKDYYKTIFVKTNIAERLEEQLASPSWKRSVINIGGVTDSYQQVESEYKLMRQVLPIMIKYKNPIIISTKSDLILRDFDLIEELAAVTYVNVASTITTVDERLREKLEPGAVSSARRFSMLKEFSKTKASTGVHVMPLVPFLTDSEENISALYEGAADCNADYLLPQFLNLKGQTRQEFFNFLYSEYPNLIKPYLQLFNDKKSYAKHKGRVYKIIRENAEKHKITSDYMAPMRKWRAVNEEPIQREEQLSYF